MQFDGDKITLEGIVAESWAMPLKNFLEGLAPARVNVDLKECRDMHTAVTQLLIAYCGIYGANYDFAEEDSTYKLLLQGAQVIE